MTANARTENLSLVTFSKRLVMAANRRFILKGTKIASDESLILPIHSPDGDTILQSSTASP